MTDTYLIPQGETDYIFEEVIKKSRFITYIRHTCGDKAAKAWIQSIKAEHPHARHWCWGYVAGTPNDSVQLGFSDDGEPSGTAGKPILNQLLGSGIGEISAVVVRYYGGVRLGTGGLVKAYGGGVQQALKLVETTKKVLMTACELRFRYEQQPVIEHCIQQFSGTVINAEYREQVCWRVAVPRAKWSACQQTLIERCRGDITVVNLDDE